MTTTAAGDEYLGEVHQRRALLPRRYVAFGGAVNDEGDDFHGAGAVRFDTKVEDGPDAEGGER